MKYRKVHLPGHEEHEPERPFQHLERRYFEEGPDGFDVSNAFGGLSAWRCVTTADGETYRVMALKGVEVILIGYNTPMHYAPDPSQDALQSFHNQLVMQATCQMEPGLLGLQEALKKASILSLSR